MIKILFLCTGNSCRSIMAEGLLNHFGKYRFQAFSGGSNPVGAVHPMTIATLKEHGITMTGYRSKSWDEFIGKPIDIVITVCNRAAGEACPIFYGDPIRKHWNIPDYKHYKNGRKIGFDGVYDVLEPRIKALLQLPIEHMDREELVQKLDTL